jgi:RNA polymerase sigma-70 factor, ECF subfamily
MKQDELTIINRILNGEEEAYGLLIDRYKEGLYHHCFKFVRDEWRAEDLAQEAFIKAYVRLADFDRVHAFSTWLYKIATNLALSELHKKRPLALHEETLDLLVGTLPPTERSSIHAELHQAIEQLPANHKTTVKLYYFRGKPYAEIAREMNTTVGSVKVWMYRAKKQLKEMLS